VPDQCLHADSDDCLMTPRKQKRFIELFVVNLIVAQICTWTGGTESIVQCRSVKVLR